MKKVLLLAGTALLMAACSEVPTAPPAAKKTPAARSNHDDLSCRSGYIVAYDEDGNAFCSPG